MEAQQPVQALQYQTALYNDMKDSTVQYSTIHTIWYNINWYLRVLNSTFTLTLIRISVTAIHGLLIVLESDDTNETAIKWLSKGLEVYFR